MYIEFTPSRLVTGGDGKLEADLQQLDPALRTKGSVTDSISGLVAATIYHLKEETSVTTVPMQLTPAEFAEWREFGASCAFAELFTCDLEGTEASPVDPRSVYMKENSFKITRMPGRFFSFSFTVVEVVA